MPAIETASVPLSEIGLPEELWAEFNELCDGIDDKLAEATVDLDALQKRAYQEARAEYERRYGEQAVPPGLGISLASFDRSDRAQRKLDKALRYWFGVVRADETQGALIYPYDPTLPSGQLYQPLLDLYPSGKTYSISVIRCVTSHDDEDDGSWLLGKAEYRLTASSLKASALPDEAMDLRSVQWVLDSIDNTDFEEAAHILSEPVSSIPDYWVTGQLWTRLRLAEHARRSEAVGRMALAD